MVKLREARGEREIGLFMTTRIQQLEEKKTGKIRQFARCFIHWFIPTVFKVNY